MYLALGENVCKALPALHALTGCDFNPSFYGKGKLKAFNLMSDSFILQKALYDLSNLKHESESTIKELEKFICVLYGLKNVDNLHEAWFEIFSKAYGTRNVEDYFKIDVKGYDACNLPPCKAEFLQQFLRTAYISYSWVFNR